MSGWLTVLRLGLVQAGIGAMVMLLPGFGETNIPTRIKLAIALLLTLIILPLHRTAYQVDMSSLTPLMVLMLHEIIIGIVVFALADFTVATLHDGQFVGLETRTDALYFTLATLLTVGFGDVHAAGQLARALVSIQMVFNVLMLATAGQIAWRSVTEQRRDGASAR